MAIEITKATLTELEELRKLSIKTFKDTYGHQNTTQDMALYLEENFSLSALRDQLLNPDSEFFFARNNQLIAGYIKVNYGNAQTELQNKTGLELERIYVIKEAQGSGLGRLLLQKAIHRAKEVGLEHVWLGVWEKNLKAVRFYETNGFRQFDTHTFTLGKDEQSDLLMRIDL
ncbi:GNAT family N-acetyltransferase [Fulvivirga sp. M361]|uniref:GNAT family N-acetyltransferase n=1 Tax=Fulvivirga sp. M361 TaxID=2594266 RepID=UPI00117BACEE|nr:GNAT family N-acetyltransferase [Fulvivirga sp. M361]TRX52669.1 GNAT family N-acetyltransferase [Fulvivirga sp. M361]